MKVTSPGRRSLFMAVRILVPVSSVSTMWWNNLKRRKSVILWADTHKTKKLILEKKFKANLRDLIAATGLVILLKIDSNRRFFSPCDLEIWWMTSKNYRAPLLCCFKLCASFHSHRWIQTKITVRKPSIRVQIGDLLSRVTLKFDGWPWKQ